MKKIDVEYITWKDFKKNSDYFDGELSKVFFKYKNKKDQKTFKVYTSPLQKNIYK